jgi:hypothetical protein
MIYIVDIDGTLFDISHRLHFINGEHKDWTSFYKACVDDKPIFEVISVIRALSSAGHTIVYSTGRPTSIYAETVATLSKYRLPQVQRMYMRPDGDHREDFVVKSELLDNIIQAYGQGLAGYGGAFEDRQQVVRLYRDRGLKVFQVADGNF